MATKSIDYEEILRLSLRLKTRFASWRKPLRGIFKVYSERANFETCSLISIKRWEAAQLEGISVQFIDHRVNADSLGYYPRKKPLTRTSRNRCGHPREIDNPLIVADGGRRLVSTLFTNGGLPPGWTTHRITCRKWRNLSGKNRGDTGHRKNILEQRLSILMGE